MTPFSPFRLRRSLALRPAVALLLVTCGMALGAACGDASVSQNGFPLVTLDECQELGGTPLFDPKDERPLDQSCPESLYFLGEFEEPFFGEDGGICCAGTEPDEPAPSAASAASAE